MSKWVSVKDSLPKHCVDCAVIMDGFVYTGYLSLRDRWLINIPGSSINRNEESEFDGNHSTIVGRNITNWAKLPESE